MNLRPALRDSGPRRLSPTPTTPVDRLSLTYSCINTVHTVIPRFLLEFFSLYSCELNPGLSLTLFTYYTLQVVRVRAAPGGRGVARAHRLARGAGRVLADRARRCAPQVTTHQSDRIAGSARMGIPISARSFRYIHRSRGRFQPSPGAGWISSSELRARELCSFWRTCAHVWRRPLPPCRASGES